MFIASAVLVGLVLWGALAAVSARAAAWERWVYCAQNLWVDKNVDELESLLCRAASAGDTHVLLSDSKFAKLGDMGARYFRNVERIKKLAGELKLEIVPALTRRSRRCLAPAFSPSASRHLFLGRWPRLVWHASLARLE